MTVNDPVVEAIASLREKHQEALREAHRIEVAISALEQLVPAFTSRGEPVFREADFALIHPSVKTMMLALLSESDRDWSVNEILAEYESRGTPVQAKDPSNALRAAVAEANKAGTIFRTAPGRYKSAKWPAPDPSAITYPSKEDEAGALGEVFKKG